MFTICFPGGIAVDDGSVGTSYMSDSVESPAVADQMNVAGTHADECRSLTPYFSIAATIVLVGVLGVHRRAKRCKGRSGMSDGK
jgi:hypothetical protein